MQFVATEHTSLAKALLVIGYRPIICSNLGNLRRASIESRVIALSMYRTTMSAYSESPDESPCPDESSSFSFNRLSQNLTIVIKDVSTKLLRQRNTNVRPLEQCHQYKHVETHWSEAWMGLKMARKRKRDWKKWPEDFLRINQPTWRDRVYILLRLSVRSSIWKDGVYFDGTQYGIDSTQYVIYSTQYVIHGTQYGIDGT